MREGDEPGRGMDLVDVIRVLLRQWMVILVGVALTGAAGVAVLQVVPPIFQASAQVILLLKPEASGEDTPTNPYLNLDSNLTTVASLLAASQSAPGAQEDREEAGYDADVSVVLQPGVGPVISVSTAHADPAQALRTRDHVIGLITADLTRLQDDANPPERQRIESRVLSAPTEAVQLSGSKIRALAVVALLGGVSTLAAAMLRDRAARARAAAGGEEEEVDDPLPVDVRRVRPHDGPRRTAS